jgi:hypothetical protein
MVKHVPAGQCGRAKVDHFHIGEREFSFMVMRQAVTRGREPATPEGYYCRLIVGGQVVMSDTYLEQDTNREVVSQARGDVLIAGLGLGFILVPILNKKVVKSVTVIENNQDVIDLIGPNFNDPRLTIVPGDIFKWRPPKGVTYTVIYFDIWPYICADNLKEMARLERRFRPRLQKNGWMDSWAKARCKRVR